MQKGVKYKKVAGKKFSGKSIKNSRCNLCNIKDKNLFWWIIILIILVAIIFLIRSFTGNVVNNSSDFSETRYQTDECFDSDGLNFYEFGYASYRGKIHKDVCVGNWVWEQYCDISKNFEMQREPHKCINGCENGACLG